MEYSEKEIEFLAKSMYKAVKKALGNRKMQESTGKTKLKEGKTIIEDIMDPNFIAEAKEKSPATRVSNMNKSKGLDKLKEFKGNLEKKKKDRCWKEYEPTPGKEPYSEGSCRKK
jgi:hypothetical protein